jgi:hypothetical protein
MNIIDNKGVLLYNRGEKCIVRAIVALHTLREHWDGSVTFFLEDPYPHEFAEVCQLYDVNVIECEAHPDTKTLVRKTELFVDSPYENTLWLDADTVTVGKIDEMFDYLENYDIAIPHFAGWWSDGGTIGRRIKRYQGIAEQSFIDEALKHHPAINTGVLSYRRNVPFMIDWIELAQKGMGKMFIPDEVAFQVLYPSYQGIYIAPLKFNVSVKHDPGTEDKRIIHYHGQKHCLPFPLCDKWKKVFADLCSNNIANINYYVERYADRRLKKVLRGEKVWDDGEEDEDKADKIDKVDKVNDENPKTPKTEDKKRISILSNIEDVTIVTACDEKYVDVLRETFPNWRKYKNIDKYPVIVFVHGIPEGDSRLDFLRLSNVRIIPWAMDNVESHREEMLSAFVFGTAEHVKTTYWLKLDADSYATDDRPFIDDSMKQYDFCGHRWGYSRPDHIKKLDEWAKKHGKPKLKNARPMFEDGKVQGNRFYHKTKRTISYIQLHKTKFTRFCVKLLDERRLPAPTQDTFMFYVANRFDPDHVGIKNFKRNYGFTQGKGKWGAEGIRKKLQEVDAAFETKKNNPIIENKEEEIDENGREDSSEENIKVEMVTAHTPQPQEPQEPQEPSREGRKPFIIPEGEGVIIEIRQIQ